MDIHLLGIPMDLGQKRRGVDMGPSALRYANLTDALCALGHTVEDRGDLRVPNPEDTIAAPGQARVEAVATVCQDIYTQGRNAVEAGHSRSFSVVITVSRLAPLRRLRIKIPKR